jgi:hypothetical protein
MIHAVSDLGEFFFPGKGYGNMLGLGKRYNLLDPL